MAAVKSTGEMACVKQCAGLPPRLENLEEGRARRFRVVVRWACCFRSCDDGGIPSRERPYFVATRRQRERQERVDSQFPLPGRVPRALASSHWPLHPDGSPVSQ